MQLSCKITVISLLSILLFVVIISVDLLIHDSQYLKFALTKKSSWSAVPSNSTQIQMYLKIIRKYKPRLVVDIGCGEGKVLETLRAGLGTGYRIEGVEVNRKSAEAARRLVPGMVIHNIDMQNYVPEANISVCYILYEPLWDLNTTEALKIYTKFMDSAVSVASGIHIIYAAGVRKILDQAFFEKRNLRLRWTKRVGSFFLRRTIHHYSREQCLANG
jgi:predicted RNA methylase